MTHNVLSIDAWAGEEKGTWTWNNWYKAGELPAELLNANHKDILAWFRNEGLLNKGVGLNRVYIEDDQYNLVITRKRDNMPLYAIEYGNA